MSEELTALIQNGTRELVPQYPSQNIVGCKWVLESNANQMRVLSGARRD